MHTTSTHHTKLSAEICAHSALSGAKEDRLKDCLVPTVTYSYSE